MFQLIALPLVCLLIDQTPDAPITKQIEKKLISAQADLNPFPNVSRESLIKASHTQSLKNTELLDKAWIYYQQFRGSWSPSAPKPDPEALAAFGTFSNQVKSSPLPKWATASVGDSQPRVRKMTLDTSDPAFKSVCQTPETQLVKTICLVYLTEHELDHPGAYKTGSALLYQLTEETPFDPDARMLFARAAVDAKDYTYGFYQARIGLYLTEDPSRNDMEFFCFIGAFAGKDKWDSIQATLRLLAKDPQVAESVIAKQAVLFGPNARQVTTSTLDWKTELQPKKP